jgi:hypothetical protein
MFWRAMLPHSSGWSEWGLERDSGFGLLGYDTVQ